jgi:hypothetical protein
MQRISDFISAMREQGRTRCDGLPHERFVTKLTKEEVVNLMTTVVGWANDENPHLRKHGEEAVEKYTPYLHKELNEIPYDILNGMYNNLLVDDQGEVYRYDSCCN